MRTFSMDMSSFEVESSEVIVSDYSDEVLSSGWIPSLACHQPCTDKTAMPVELARVDVDAFLCKMYTYQH